MNRWNKVLLRRGTSSVDVCINFLGNTAMLFLLELPRSLSGPVVQEAMEVCGITRRITQRLDCVRENQNVETKMAWTHHSPSSMEVSVDPDGRPPWLCRLMRWKSSPKSDDRDGGESRCSKFPVA
jgi:hypothetical protein